MLSTNQQHKPQPNGRRLTTVASVMLGAALTLTACGGNEDTVKAVDKVDEAAELARQNAPEPEPMPVEESTAEVATSEEAEAESASADEAPAEESSTEAEGEEAPLAASAGKDLYESTCKMCHESGLLNAPKLGDTADWEPRIAQGKETLYKHSAEGFNQMPPQATGDVTVEQVHAAVDYMVDQAS